MRWGGFVYSIGARLHHQVDPVLVNQIEATRVA